MLAFVYIGTRILQLLLSTIFSIPSDFAAIVAAPFILLATYPLFIRGTANIWTRDKRRWSFLPYAVFVLLFTVLAILAYYIL